MIDAGNICRLSQLLAGITVVEKESDVSVSALALSSQTASRGCLFLACRGLTRHGLAFATQAVRQGAVAIVWEPESDMQAPELDVPVVRVEGLSDLIGKIASRFYGEPSKALNVIGVTGTNGKTSVTHFLAQALNKPEAPCGVIGTLGSGLYGKIQPTGYTTPDALTVHRQLAEFRQQGARHVVMEVSSHALDQGRVNDVIFTTAVFTNLSRDHLDYHGDMGSYAAIKQRLFTWPGLKNAVINADDKTGASWFGVLQSDVRPIAVTQDIELDDIETLVASHVTMTPEGIGFEVESPEGSLRLESSLMGEFNVDNLLLCLAVLTTTGLSLQQAAERLKPVTSAPGRMECLTAKGLPRIVVDYAHTPDALEKVLLSLQSHYTGPNRLIVVFGCGGERDQGKRPMMARVAELNADQLIITDDNPRNESPEKIVNDMLQGLSDPNAVKVIHDRAEAISAALDMAEPSDCVLVAGKGHEDYQIIGTTRKSFSDLNQVKQWLYRRTQ